MPKQNKSYRRRFFTWKRAFGFLLFLWFGGLVVFFTNPKGFQQWLTHTFEGETEQLSERFPQTCAMHFTHAWRMNDNVREYWRDSAKDGLEQEPIRIRDIKRALIQGELVAIESNEYYFVDTMWYSYPFSKQYVKGFIDDLCLRFQEKLRQTDLAGTKLVLTSLLRTKSSVSRLLRKNKNAIKHSSHLHGTTFDISYHTFIHDRPLNDGEIAHLKETLAETLYEMREEKRCYVTYEYFQTCFHVVCRQQKQISNENGRKDSRKLERTTSARV